LASPEPDSIRAAIEDTIKTGLDIYPRRDEPERDGADSPQKPSESIAAALLASSQGAELLGLSRTVGLSIGGLSLELPPEVVQAITEEVMRQVRAELLAGIGSESEFLDTKEAAAFLRSSTQRVYDLVSKRQLRPHKDGSRNLFRRSELEDYLRGAGGHR